MANRRGKKEVDAEVDLHGLTVEQMRVALQRYWPVWRGLRSVRIIHGRGEALKPEVERWCREMGVPCALDAGNPGATQLFPAQRTLPDRPLGISLRDKGLRLTPEEEAVLRDPQAVERSRQEALRQQKAEERRRAEEAYRNAAQQRRDETLWQAEMARLDALDRKRGAATPTDAKPGAPIILPPTEIKHQEGYWRAEMVRVADTDTDTLKKQKRTGLDKLAPPMEPKPADQPAPAKKPTAPPRNTAADRALFEAEMARLAGTDPNTTRREKRE